MQQPPPFQPNVPPPQVQHTLSAVQSMHAHMNAGSNARPPIGGVQTTGPPYVRQPSQSYPQLAQSQPQHEGYRHPPVNPDNQAALLEAHRLFSQAHAQEIQQLQQVQQVQQRRDRVPPPPQAFAPPPPPQRVLRQPASDSQAHSVQGAHAQAVPQSQGPPPTSQPSSSNTSEMVASRMTVEEVAALRARQILDSTHKSVYDSLNKAHTNVAQELRSLHTGILKRDAALRDVHARFAQLSKDFTQVQAHRQELEQQCARLKAEKERAEAEAAKVNEHLPKFIAEYCEMRADRARLAAELAALREAGAPLKDKSEMVVEDISPSFSSNSFEGNKLPVKTEAPNTVSVKNEWKVENSPVLSMADHDATVARALAEAHEERKRRQRVEHELEVMRGVLTVASAAIKTSGSPNNAPGVLPSIPAPQAETPASQELTMATEANSSAAHTTNQSVDVSRPPSAKVESQDDSMPFWMIPGSELIDLTSLDDSPMQFSGDFMDGQESAEPERKRALDADANTTQEHQPALKRQKTLNVVPTRAQPAEEGPIYENAPAVASDDSPPRADATQDSTMSDEPAAPVSITQYADPVVSSPASSTTSPPDNASSSLSSTPPALSGLSLPSSPSTVQLPGQPQLQTQLPTPTSPDAPKRLSMLHMPLIFETIGNTMQCRLCERRQADLGTPLYILDKDTANWDQMAGHCEREHPIAHRMLVELGPTQIMEERQRLEARPALAVKVRA
ncbi:hypothetical protein ONZ51_g1720 [Trametes cubensis]|uniref:Uncharacterized protein n=1 Tax=Trametes cubensis TaxID=1111947 RepID=A0AAD7U250_9APHY|nr:hypothetical protein ONZ51_g1720 [Trametes cubensis]